MDNILYNKFHKQAKRVISFEGMCWGIKDEGCDCCFFTYMGQHRDDCTLEKALEIAEYFDKNEI